MKATTAIVTLQIATCDENVPAETAFERWVGAALHGRKTEAEVTVRIVGADEGRTLNRRYRGRDYPTNVLSFPADLPPELELPLLGDLVLCAPVVETEAREQRKALDAHWAHLTVHGVLHLLGFDHEDSEEADEMERLETKILRELDFPDPYA